MLRPESMRVRVFQRVLKRSLGGTIKVYRIIRREIVRNETYHIYAEMPSFMHMNVLPAY